MRADYLDRFAEHFTGGLRRFLEEGVVFEEGHQDHARSVTAAGHATISTGVHPSRHGIVGNDFVDRRTGRPVYSASDPDAPLLGAPGVPGRSPGRLLREGLADWLKEASPESKVLSVSIKDRSAIMMAGRHPDGVYWYLPRAKGMVTSSYYAAEYPGWVDAFNRSGLLDSFSERRWERLLPEAMYAASREDSFPAEGAGRRFTFPYDFRRFESSDGGLERGYYAYLPYTPYGDDLLFAFVREGIVQERLGADDAPDLLFIGVSSADYIGHRWGPMSQEVQDYYLRLDRALGALFGFLDERVGRDRYVVALSADHGAGLVPEELQRRGRDARRITGREYRVAILGAVNDGLADLGIEATPRLRFLNGLLISFPDDPGAAARLPELRVAVVRRLREVDFVADAFTAEEVQAADPEGAGLRSLFRRSYHPDRSADVMIHLREGYAVGSTPATHGSAHRYDTHVPIAFLGAGIVPGRRAGRVRTVDVAPTLARLLLIPTPDDLDGRPLDLAGS